MSKKVSVIIPVYNVEKYLNRCIDSIINQTYKNIEIILINDGSTDNSGEICDYYAYKYSNIHSFHKMNEGVSSARNFGIKKSNGEYIVFIDSDDYIESNMIENLIQIKKDYNCDIVECGYRIIEDTELINIMNQNIKIDIYNRVNAIEKLVMNKGITNYLWGKLFNKSLFLDLEIPNHLTYQEDLAIMFQLFNKIEKIAITSEVMYNYFKHSESCVNNITPLKTYHSFLALLSRQQIIEEKYSNLKKYNLDLIAERSIATINSIIRSNQLYLFNDELKNIKYIVQKNIFHILLSASISMSTKYYSILLLLNFKIYIKICNLNIKNKLLNCC